MMRGFSRILTSVMTVVFLFSIITGCVFNVNNKAEIHNAALIYDSFREIPGVSEEDIKAVEALREKYDSFSYGTLMSSEAFFDTSGEMRGYIVLLCDWLTDLFDIRFVPVIYNWDELLGELDNRAIDFTNITLKNGSHIDPRYKTGAVAERTIESFKMGDCAPLMNLHEVGTPRFSFLRDAGTYDAVSGYIEYEFESIFVDRYSDAHDMLMKGEIDAFFDYGIAEAAFLKSPCIIKEVFYPAVIYHTVSISTHDPALEPIITIIDKFIESNGIRHLTGLYESGLFEYMGYKMSLLLTDEEMEYIKNSSGIKYAAEHYNYPVSFYNKHENEWQGIAHDVLHDVEKLTGLNFELINDHDTQWPELLRYLESGEGL